MDVKLIAITKPVDTDCADANELIAYCARVSSPGNQNNHGTAPKLLRYLVDHKHWSPFEMASMTLMITTTRDIARQILRHRSFSFQEFSQRYAMVESPHVMREARLQDAKNRQASIETDDHELASWWRSAQDTVASCTVSVYNGAINRGIAKEVARAVLPEGMTESSLYMAGTIRSWIHYCELRTGPETQKEHREVAEECQRILWEEFPSIGDAFKKRGK